MNKKNVNAVENAKVANIIYKFYPTGTTGFLKDGDTLVSVFVSSVRVDLKKQLVTSVLKDVNEKEFVREGDYSLYQSTKAFEDGDPKTRCCYHTFDLLKSADWKRTTECVCHIIDEDNEKGTSNVYLEVWIFENGEAKNVPAEIFSVEKSEQDWHIVEGHLPELFYESRNLAYSCNEYKVVDTDGEEFIEQGIAKRLAFNPEQLEIYKTLKETLKKAKDANIRFVWDRDNYSHLKAFNGDNISGIEWGSDTEADKGGDKVQIKDALIYDTEFSFHDYCGCDGDNSDWIIFKPTARQLKQWKKEHPDCKD